MVGSTLLTLEAFASISPCFWVPVLCVAPYWRVQKNNVPISDLRRVYKPYEKPGLINTVGSPKERAWEHKGKAA